MPDRISATLGAVLREPLLHFALLGLALLALYRLVAPTSAGRTIVVSTPVVQGLREDYRRRNGAAPSAEEEAGLVQRYIDNEVLYREAVALGLDRGDVIVRRRMIQKMEFLAEQLAPHPTPTDADLSTFLQEHADAYAIPGRITFTHVFIRNGDDGTQRALAAQQALRNGTAADALGDPFLRGRVFTSLSSGEVAAIFGDEFAAALLRVQANTWFGPLHSAFGYHIVKITGREASRLPDLAEVRDSVARAWTEQWREQATKAELEQLRGRYTIVREP